MKITIEPSDPSFPAARVTLDLRRDDEGTSEAVECLLNALILYGHDQGNVVDGAEQYAGTMRKVDRMRDIEVCDD